MSDRFDHTLEHTLKTKPGEPEADDAVAPVRRIELITGPGLHSGRRRQWSGDDKARIIVESFKPGANVSEVARRNGLSPQQLFGWRREARELMAEDAAAADTRTGGQPSSESRKTKSGSSKSPACPSTDGVPVFASVVVAAPAPPSPPPPPDPPVAGRIEIVIGDIIVRVIGSVEAAHLTAVLRAVRRAT